MLTARGEGAKYKTALHVAAEHCHAAIVEYIVDVTQGRLNLEIDTLGIPYIDCILNRYIILNSFYFV